MSREALSEEKIKVAFEDYKNGDDLNEVADRNGVSARSLQRYFSRRKLKKKRPRKCR